MDAAVGAMLEKENDASARDAAAADAAERRAALRCDGRRMIKSGHVPAAPPPTTSARRRAEASTHRSFLGKYGLDAVDGDVVVKR